MSRFSFKRWPLAALALLLAGALIAASAALAGARHARVTVGRQAAVRAALRALQVDRHTDPEIVFALQSPLPAGSSITRAGPSGPSAGGRATGGRAATVAAVKHDAWFFYEDLGPFQAYEHPGRVALVDARTGAVSVSQTLSWPPAVDGELPPFLRSADAYASPDNRVFYRHYVGGSQLARSAAAAHGRDSAPAVMSALDQAQARRAAAILAAEHSCAVRFSNSLPGGFYALSLTPQSRAALGYRFEQLSRANPGFRSSLYPKSSRVAPMTLVRDEISKHGCRDMLIYIAGAGYQGATAVNIGMQLDQGRVVHQDITLSDLRDLISSERGVAFKLVIDAPYASGFQSLTSLGNVVLTATPVAPKGRSFTYLPEAIVGGKLVHNDTNPFRLMQLTDRLAFGMNTVIDDSCELTQAGNLQKGGGPALAYFLARAFARGGPVDWVARAGLGSPPDVRISGFSAGAPNCQPPDVVTAAADAYNAGNGSALNTSAAQGVLANDSDTLHTPLAVDQLNGSGGALPLHGTSAKGAAVTLNGDGSFTYDATGSAALQALPRGQTTSDSFTYRASDGHGATSTATVAITVTGTVNHAPTAHDDTASTSNNAAFTSDSVLANDSDPDGDTLTIDQLNGVGGTPPINGHSAKGASVKLGPAGKYIYDPTVSATLQALPRGQSTTDTFTYRVNDGHGGTSTATVTVTVTGVVNHPPAATADSYSVQANATLSKNAAGGVLANDTDADSDSLTVDQLNGTGGTAPFTGTTGQGASVTLNADGSFSYDPTGSATLQALGHGQTKDDTFTYRVNDGHGGTDTGTVTVMVTGVNHPPAANADGYSVNNNAVLTKNAAGGVLANDTDADGDALTVDQLNGTGGTAPFTATTGKGASVTLNADGSFSYDPTGSATLAAIPRGQTTTDTFTYRANDGHGGTATGTVTITITGAVNHPPVANADSYSVGNSSVTSKDATAGVLANDTDPDGDSLTVDQLNGTGGTAPFTATTGQGASVKLNADGSFTYDPTGSATLQAIPRGQTASDSFSYRVNDGRGGMATATVTLTVSGALNHPPVATADSYSASNNAVLTQNAAGGVLANDTDADNDVLTVDQLNGTGGTAPFTATTGKGASVTLNADGSFSYDPTGSATLQAIPRGQTASDSFTYEANDGHGGTSTATVTLTVSGALNHPPVATADSYSASNNAVLTQNAAGGVLANDTDADNDVLTVDQLNGTGGTAPFTATTGKGASVTLNADGSFSYDPTGSATLAAIPRGQTTTDTFTYRANDGHGGTSTATVTITVTGAINHAPTANADSYVADNNATLTQGPGSGLLANDTDPDGDTLTVDQLNGTGGTAPFTAASNKGASVTVNADGSFSYDPTGSATLQAIPRGGATSDTFSYRANDGHGGTSTATVTITVVGLVNHPPVANADSYAVNNNVVSTENAAAGVLANDTDADGDVLTVDQLNGTAGTAPFTGTSAKGAAVTLNADGSFSYDPTGVAALHPPNLPVGTSTTDTFTYEANDGHGGTATATVTMTVTAVDTPPTAPDYTVTGSAVGNTLLEVGTVASPSSEPKLTNSTDGILNHASDPDPGDSITVTAFDATSAQGGNVNVDSSTGGFSYRPKAGFTGSDSFHYTVTDQSGESSTGIVTISVGNMVWYVRNNAGGANDGRSGSPFTSLASTESASASAAGDFIYVYKGDGTTNGQDSGITLKANQTLLSEKHDLVVGGHTLAAGTPANRPLIGNSAGDGVTLASGDTVKGFDITGTGSGSFAIAGGSGDASGTIADDVLHGASTAGGLTLNSTSGTWAVSDLTSTGTGGAAFDANAAGTVNFTGTNSLTGSGAGAFKNAGSTTYSGTIGTTSSTGGAANGIDVSGAGGSITFDGGTLSGTTSNAILASGGSINATYNGTETNSSGHSVQVTGRSGGTVDVESTIDDTGTGVSITGNTAGTTTINSNSKTINTGGSPAIAISGNTAQTVNITGGGLSAATTSGDGLSINGPAAVTVSGGSDTMDTNGSGTALHIQGASSSNISSDAALNGSVTNTGHSVNISGHTGGTIAQSGSVKDRGTGLTLTSNTGATINFSGKIDASTGTNAAFTATGGGTVSASATTSTLTTTTGTALDVESTSIGSSNLIFQSITANGGSHGIVLVSTGSSGHLSVTGTGVTSGSGGSITGITGADAATNACGDLGSTVPAGVGVYLKNTSSPSLANMTFPGTFGNFGILGYSVSGFSLDNTTLTGTYGDNVNQDEDAVHFCTLTGSASITNDTIANGAESNLRVVNASGTLNRLTMTNDTFGLNGTSGGSDSVLLEADGGTFNATVEDATFQGARGSDFQAVPQAGATMDLVFGQPGHGNHLHNTHTNVLPFAQDANIAAGGTLTFDVNGNTFDVANIEDDVNGINNIEGGVFINAANSTAAASGYFRNNTIGISGTANSGSRGNLPGLDVESNGGGTLTAKIDNNQIFQYGANGAGVLVQAGAGNPTSFNVTFTGNTIAQPGTFAQANNQQGFQLNNGTQSGENFTSCIDFAGNTINGSGTGAGGDARFRQRFDTKVDLPGYGGASNGSGVPAYIQGLNPTGPPTVTQTSSTGNGGGFFNTPGGAACPIPNF